MGLRADVGCGSPRRCCVLVMSLAGLIVAGCGGARGASATDRDGRRDALRLPRAALSSSGRRVLLPGARPALALLTQPTSSSVVTLLSRSRASAGGVGDAGRH